MNKKHPLLFNFLLIFLLGYKIQAKNKVIYYKEVFHVKTSLVLIQEPKDSILEKKYEELNLLTETSNYVESLQKALYLDEQVSSSDNSMLKFKIKFKF